MTPLSCKEELLVMRIWSEPAGVSRTKCKHITVNSSCALNAENGFIIFL